ncbi:MAG: cryptochrome/photolyase family protein [Deltaproteobacteria bacterium]|nr:cryptochrome/photolyase family protein [Deltaproteobacteria bacterium]
MSAFGRALAEATPKRSRRSRRWVYVPYDQLTDAVGPLAETPPGELGIVLVEAPAKAARRPYHKQKLALVLANMRHFAVEQAARGVQVRHEVAKGGYREALERVVSEVGPLAMMEAAERELRVELEPLVRTGALSVAPHAAFLTTREDFVASAGASPPWRMETFYKHVRGKTGILMKGGKPEGGKYSFDAENRRPWRGDPRAPSLPRFEVDAITKEVGELVATRFADHPGELHTDRLPTTKADAERLWAWARESCLPFFGPFEDAMSTQSATLFHTCVSSLLNLTRLLPARLVADAAGLARLPLASREGFVRQTLGWREFVRHVHRETDGFRTIAADGSAVPASELGASLPLPDAFWGKASGLGCLDHVVTTVWRDGYSHHITRLMILSNLATLLGLDPRALSDWFWVAYTDAYDWVVEPNVLGMGTYSAGPLMTTKPYVSGAAYIDKMSDYCGSCAFDPKKTCPITRLYWAFLAEHADRFAKNPRTSGPVASARRRAEAERAEDVRVRERVRELLGKGQLVTPASLVRRERAR